MNMELASSNPPFYGSFKRYWRRRSYQRLDVSSRKTRTIRLGGERKRSSSSRWRIKVIRKLKFGWKIVSPIKLLSKLRDAYINMMLSIAGNYGSSTADSFFGQKRIPKARKTDKASREEAFQSKLVLEIYKALKASRQLSSY